MKKLFFFGLLLLPSWSFAARLDGGGGSGGGTGDITAVTAGLCLDGGGTSGSVTVDVDTACIVGYVPGGSVTPGLPFDSVQLNGGGVFIGTSSLTMNTTSNLLTIGATTFFTSVSTTQWTNVTKMTFSSNTILDVRVATFQAGAQVPGGVLFQNIDGTIVKTSTGSLRIDESALLLDADRGPNLIGGYKGNFIATTSFGSAISGGGHEDFENKIFDSLGTQNTWMYIGGGYDNQMDACWPSVIGGGAHNRINLTSVLSPYDSYAHTPSTYTNHSAILSGTYNTSNYTVYGTIAGGNSNYMDPRWYTFSPNQGSLGSATIGGGQFNFMTGSYATLAGGRAGWVSTSNSFMGGGVNNVLHDGSAVITGGDSNSTINGAYSTNFGLTNKVNANRVPRWYLITLGSQASGTFELVVNSSVSAAIAYNASSTTVQTALQNIVGASSVTVTGATGGPYTVLFSTFGSDGSTIGNTTFLTMNTGALGTPVNAFMTFGNRFALSLTNVTGGTYEIIYGRDYTTLPYPLQKTSALAYNASSATIQSALESLASIGTGNCLVVYETSNTRWMIDIAPTQSRFNMFINGENLLGSGISFAADGGTSPDITAILSGRNNNQYGAYSQISGGRANSNFGLYSSQGGGAGNAIHGTNSVYGTIGGGIGNYMGGYGTLTAGTIGGGQGNGVYRAWGTVGGGNLNISTGNAATIPGGQQNIAWGDYSTVMGLRGKSTRYGEHVIASGRFVEAGDAQAARMTLRRQTTNATPTELAPDGAGTNRLTTKSSTTVSVQLTLVGRRVDGGASEYAKYRMNVLVTRESDVTSSVKLFEDKTVDYESDATWDVTLTVSTSSGVMQFLVTGAAGKTINWIAECVLVEVSG